MPSRLVARVVAGIAGPLLGATIFVSAAGAGSSPPALSAPSTFAYGAVGYSSSTDVSNTCSLTGANCAVLNSYSGDTYSASAAFTPVSNYINPSATATASAAGGLYALGQSTVSYNFEVYIPSQTGSPPVVTDLTASGSVIQSTTTNVNPSQIINDASVQIGNSNQQFAALYCVGTYEGNPACGQGTPSTSFSITNQPVNIYANEVYTVTIGAAAEDLYNDVSLGASIDPFISIDPESLLAYPDAQLVLSPGVVQQQPVPAPLIGHGLPAVLAVGGLLFGAKLWSEAKSRCAIIS
jgi:hypothetical protein